MPAKLRRGGRSVRGGRRSALRCNVSSRHYTINVQGNVKAACDAGPRAGFVFNDINQLIWYLLGVRIRRPYWPVTVEEYQMPVGAVAITLQRLLSLRRRLPFGPAGWVLTAISRYTRRACWAACGGGWRPCFEQWVRKCRTRPVPTGRASTRVKGRLAGWTRRAGPSPPRVPGGGSGLRSARSPSRQPT